MANEITLNTTLKVANGPSHVINNNLTQTTPGGVLRRQTIPTSDTVVTLTGVTTPCAMSIKNTDTVNYISVGATVTGAIAPLIQLQPGMQNVITLYPGAVVRAQAHTASVVLECVIYET